MILTGKLDWSLIKWIQNNVLDNDSGCVFTIEVWTWEHGERRIQVEASDGLYAEDAYAYAAVVTDFKECEYKGFEVTGDDYKNEFLRQFITKFYTLKNAKVLSISAGGVGEAVLWGKVSWEHGEIADQYASVIQRYWRSKRVMTENEQIERYFEMRKRCLMDYPRP
jgi:hypothetical protein